MTQGQAGISARIIGPIKAINPNWCSTKRWCAYQDGGHVVNRLWVAKFMSHALK
jgi:hypothetical protein